MTKDKLFFGRYQQIVTGKATDQAQDKVIELSQRINSLNRRAAILKEIAVEDFEDCLKQAERL